MILVLAIIPHHKEKVSDEVHLQGVFVKFDTELLSYCIA